jgi:hypothetical protein
MEAIFKTGSKGAPTRKKPASTKSKMRKSERPEGVAVILGEAGDAQ